VRFNNSYSIQHFRDERALNILQFLNGASAGFLRTPSLRRHGIYMPFRIHPHMLRHACGFKSNDGHDTRALQHYLGHRNIQHTVRYTEMAPDRFKDFWRG
jgi:integrase